MILECRHCGAPLDVKADVSLTKCRYCGTTSERRLLKTISAETPRNFQPPRQWIPPPHVPAPSHQPLTYHAAAPRTAVVGAFAAAILMFVVGVSVFVNIRKPRGAPGAGVFTSGLAPKDLAAVRIDQNPQNLAKALSGRVSDVMVTVPLAHDRFQLVSFLWDKDTPEHPYSFTFVPRSETTPDPRVMQAVGSRLHGGLTDGHWNWASVVSVFVDAKSGTVGASVQREIGPRGGPNPQAKAQLVALWKLLVGAVFGVPIAPTADEMRFLGAPHPFVSLGTIDPAISVDVAADTLTRKFPGAVTKTFINLDVIVSVDHPLVREAQLSFRNEKGGTMSHVHLPGARDYKSRRDAFVACLEGKLGKPEASDRDYVNKKRDYRFTVGKGWLNVNEESASVSAHGQRIQAADWTKIINAVGACR